MNEVRVDPLTGLKAIIAAARTDRPGGDFDLEPEPPIDTRARPVPARPRGPHAARAATRCGPDGGAPDTPGWTVRVVPNLYPALAPDGERACRPRPQPDLFSAQPATGAHEVIVNAPDAGHVAGRPRRPSRSPSRWRPGASGCARTPAPPACTCSSTRATRAARRSRTRTRSSTRSTSSPRRSRASASASARYATRTMGGNLLGDLVQEEVRRRERVVAVDDEAVLIAPYASRLPFQLMIAPRRPRARFEDDGPLGAAPACTTRSRACAAGSAPCRRSTCGCAPRRAAPSTSAGGSTSCRG